MTLRRCPAGGAAQPASGNRKIGGEMSNPYALLEAKAGTYKNGKDAIDLSAGMTREFCFKPAP